MFNLMLVMVGGGLGSGARYLVSTWMLDRFGPAFPWGTLTVNLCGSLLLGVIMQLGASTDSMGADARLLLGTGLMGGFTTYSTFNQETLRLLQEGHSGVALINVLVTMVASLLAAAAGMAGVRAISGG